MQTRITTELKNLGLQKLRELKAGDSTFMFFDTVDGKSPTLVTFKGAAWHLFTRNPVAERLLAALIAGGKPTSVTASPE